jgi:hypothetical protein
MKGTHVESGLSPQTAAGETARDVMQAMNFLGSEQGSPSGVGSPLKDPRIAGWDDAGNGNGNGDGDGDARSG